MTSGIYQLTFGDGYFYIGKSNNVERRWDEHWKKFSDGKAAKNMQDAFRTYGYPSRKVIELVHPDHLDIAETYWINRLWSSKILNTTRPDPLIQEEYAALDKIPDCLQYSTVDLVRNIYSRSEKIQKLEEELERINLECDAELDAIKAGTVVPMLEKEIYDIKCFYQTLKDENTRLRNRNLFERIFNI